MKIHKDYIEHYRGKSKLLADNIGNLRYDALSDLIEKITNKLYEDGLADKKRRRVKLASTLFNASKLINEGKVEIEESWRISKPFISDYE
ncbi:hypothetical protein QWY85_00290 [Neolewinella lacunae]|uniref:Uncharacterized protein n=1 Tax=Neolewinella lacunae TaxID=1517758 RepID=A0A923PJN6_9BACT|nr:hypothetical protein [Neolewinella lacunae]MBC6995363.1 hypothetical protein [Neolewinella lacunae]MDN3633075.1 hypothetical protein [Neolewinella lacunae]